MLTLHLHRIALRDTYTIGHLYVNDQYFCDTLEDTVRDLNHNGIFDNGEKKIKDRTAIPYGTYQITLDIRSPKYSNYTRYPYVRPYQAYMPRLLKVPSFDGILIHAGNNHTHTSGCILVGRNTKVGQLTSSQATWISLMETHLWPARRSKTPIQIIID